MQQISLAIATYLFCNNAMAITKLNIWHRTGRTFLVHVRSCRGADTEGACLVTNDSFYGQNILHILQTCVQCIIWVTYCTIMHTYCSYRNSKCVSSNAAYLMTEAHNLLRNYHKIYCITINYVLDHLNKSANNLQIFSWIITEEWLHSTQ